MKVVQISIFIILSSLILSYADIINVPTDIDSIQGGINLANPGDTVLVQPGIYFENIDFNGKNIVVGSLTLTTGDYSYISKTIIDGDKKRCVVNFSAEEDTSAKLCGFTIMNGSGGVGCGAGCACGYSGGGISCSSNPTLCDLKITKNSAVRGGGILLEYSNAKLINLTITENNATLGGGILFVGSKAKLSNVTITENNAERGGAILFSDTFDFLPFCSNPLFDTNNRCNIFNNTADYGSDMYYRVDPCAPPPLDSTQNSIVINVVVDTFTVLFPDSVHAYPSDRYVFDIKNAAEITSVNEKVKPIANTFKLNLNYPNPFNPSTIIEFTLPKSEFVELKVYNILGKEVSTLVSKKLNQGNYAYTFNGRNLASGIYYYQLASGEYRRVKKMILLK